MHVSIKSTDMLKSPMQAGWRVGQASLWWRHTPLRLCLCCILLRILYSRLRVEGGASCSL